MVCADWCGVRFLNSDFKSGAADAWPMFLAYVPIAMLWGTLAAAKGFSPLAALLMSAGVYAGASQFVAIEMWVDPLPIALMVFTIFVINVRHVLYAASISRHMGGIEKRWHPLLIYWLTDEAWALLERKALTQPLTLGYYLGVALPLWPTWFLSSAIGAYIGRELPDPALIGVDFAFAAMFIAILASFWKGPRTGAVIVTSAVVAVLAKIYISGAWYIVLGGFAGVAVAALVYREVAE
jgi:4-azaleucine resistance transporter AzlC